MAVQEATTMKNRSRFVLSALYLVTMSALAEESRISRVTLYAGSATVERSVAVSTEATRVELTGLPANFDMRSLRVEADPGIRIGEVAVRDVSRTIALGSREAELEARIQALKDGRAMLEVEAKSAELVRDFVASLSSRPPAEGEKRPSIDAKSIPAVIEAIRRGGGDALGAIQRVEVKKRALDKQVAALERDLARLRSGARDARILVISYSATQPGEVRALYHVANAGWQPLYRASLDSNGSKVELERQAIVTQRTGEDWRGVTLRLSTGVPRAANMVDPATWEVGIAPQAMNEARAMSDAVQGQVAARMAAPKSRVAEEARPDVVELQTQFSTEFEVPGRVDLGADGQIADQDAITSRHKAPVELLVLESAPVAVSDKITVESAFEPKPKTQNWEEKRGVIAWEQPLAPGQTLKFIADYTISYPKDLAIAGLP